MVTEQIRRITGVRSSGSQGTREILVLDELLDDWRDPKFSKMVKTLGTSLEDGISLQDKGRVVGLYWRELLSLAKRKGLLDVMEEGFL